MADFDVKINPRWSNYAAWELSVPGNQWNQEVLLRLEDLNHPAFLEFLTQPGYPRMSFCLREGVPQGFALLAGEVFLACSYQEVSKAMSRIVEALPDPSTLEF